jgi:UDP-N-acetylglucosamine 2-epimerase (non-hydrolysing)
MYVDGLLKSDIQLSSELDAELGLNLDRPFVLVTQHRRESFGDELEEIFEAILETSSNHPEVLFLIPLHKNPNVEKAAQNTILKGKNIRILKSLDYFEMVRILQNTLLIVTDSGGLQEEAPSMNIPVLITRKVTERPEVVDVGAAKLVGTSRLAIVKEIDEILNNSNYRESMRHKVNPFGDGKAALQIVEILDSFSNSNSMSRDRV